MHETLIKEIKETIEELKKEIIMKQITLNELIDEYQELKDAK